MPGRCQEESIEGALKVIGKSQPSLGPALSSVAVCLNNMVRKKEPGSGASRPRSVF